MGKNITSQKRGKGSPTYKSPGHRFRGPIKMAGIHEGIITGKVMDLINCPGHYSPLMKVKYSNGADVLLPAPEGIKVNDIIESGNPGSVKPGTVLQLESIPEGTSIYNIELQPGDGGKMVRSPGSFAKIVGKTGESIIVRLPSKKEKLFSKKCRACIGIIAGGGRTEKPFLKAGKVMRAMRAKNKLYPITSPNCMSAVAHPFGNTRSLRKSKSRPVSRNAPPGRKVGMIAARRSGRRKK